jgi:hypothetical protein
MAQTTSTHDAIFWSTLVQAAGSVAIVLATIALVWVTDRLVKATNQLSLVGEQTWKSNIKPRIWVFGCEGSFSASKGPILQISNACAVTLDNVRVNIYPLGFKKDSENNYLGDAFKIADGAADLVSVVKLGNLNVANGSCETSLWSYALASLDFLEKSSSNLAIPLQSGEQLVGGLLLSIAFTQSVTNELFHRVLRYSVEDGGKATLKMTKLHDDIEALI